MIRAFFRFIFKSLYAISAFIGGIILLVVVLSLWGMESGHKVRPLDDKSILSLNMGGEFAEHSALSEFEALLFGPKHSFFDTAHKIRMAALRSEVSALVIRGGASNLGMAQRQELRDAIHFFRDHGKKVYFYTTSFGELSSATPDYYVATAADEIWVQPIGTLNINGLNAEMPFARGTLDLIGITPEIAKRKDYKSFPEMYLRRDISPEARENTQAILSSIMDQIVTGIAKDRNMDPLKVRGLIENAPYSLQLGIKHKLIDQVGYWYSLQNKIKKDHGLQKLTLRPLHTLPLPAQPNGHGVALIFDEGTILESALSPMGGENGIDAQATYKQIMKAAKDNTIKAIVYRINSPGGSPSASETILSAILYAKSTGKPFIVSMSDAAASGGYWIASQADSIVAEPGTLTGSIGVLAGKMVLKDAWEKIDLNWSSVKTDANADMWSPNQNFTAFGWMKLNESLDNIYASFLKRVAKGRNLSVAQVEKVAKGRVWTGEQALALGLVDHLGGLHLALDIAREKASLPQDAPTIIYPEHSGLMAMIMKEIQGDWDDEDLPGQGGILSPLMQIWERLRLVMAMVFDAPYVTQADLPRF